jgi:prepilin-type N-terminal cleavage/methylation domain-containing protein
MTDRRFPQPRGFTLLEVMLSLGLFALLSLSVYAIVSSTIGASRTSLEEQLGDRRLDAFLGVMREAFLNLPPQGTVSLDFAKLPGGDSEPRLLLGKIQGILGMPSLAGGTAVLAARPRSDGTRTIFLFRIPPRADERQASAALSAPGLPLLPKVRRIRWTFFQDNGSWTDQYPAGSPRPRLVRLQAEIDGIPDPVEAIFFVPPLSPAAAAAAAPVASPSPSP